MPRLLFSKKGNAVWISHLDLMRVFQRAFKRASLPLTHTQGFNPRPSVSIALPLSVGISSECELLDFDLTKEDYTCEEIKDRLNDKLIEGVEVQEVYDRGRKLRELSYLECQVVLQYDKCLPADAAVVVGSLFQRPVLIMNKKTKSGMQEMDILPMIRDLAVERINDCELKIKAMICCQNPSLNPMQLAGAVTEYLPELAPASVNCHRIEIYDNNESIFR